MNACKPYIQNVKWPNPHTKIATLPSLPPVAVGAPSSPVIQAVQVAIQELCLVEKMSACLHFYEHTYLYDIMHVYNVFMQMCMCMCIYIYASPPARPRLSSC